jgi:uncharacterized protein YutD
MPFDTTLSSWILSRVLYHVSQLNSPFAESHVINDLKDCFSYVLLKDCFSYVLLDYQFIHVVLTLRNGLRMQASSDQTNVQSLDQTNVHLFLPFFICDQCAGSHVRWHGHPSTPSWPLSL